MVTQEKAKSVGILLGDYRMDDFVPAKEVLSDLYEKDGSEN